MAKNDQNLPKISPKWPKIDWNTQQITRSHLTSLTYDKISLKIWRNGQKAPQNVKIMQKKTKNAKKWGKNTIKMGQKHRKCAPFGYPLSLLHWGPPRKPGGLLAALANGPLVFSVGFGNIFILSMYRILWYRWNNITATCTRYSSVCTAICTINPRRSRLPVILIIGTHA